MTSMLLYKVILSRHEEKEIIYCSISTQIRLPDLKLSQQSAGAMLVITTCDLSSLDASDLAIYLQDLESRKFPKAA